MSATFEPIVEFEFQIKMRISTYLYKESYLITKEGRNDITRHI